MTVQSIAEFEEFLKDQREIYLAQFPSGGIYHKLADLIFVGLLAELKIRELDEDKAFSNFQGAHK